jgi:hypothetical protein
MIKYLYISFTVFVLLLSISYYYLGGGIKSTVKYYALFVLKPFTATAVAVEKDRTIYQYYQSRSVGQTSRSRDPVYYTAIEFELFAGNERFRSYDYNTLYRYDYPEDAIKRGHKEYGSNPITLKIGDLKYLMRNGLPWFVLDTTYNSGNTTDVSFQNFISNGYFNQSTNTTKVTYIKGLPHWNTLESHRASLFFFLGDSFNSCGMFLIATMFLPLFRSNFKEIPNVNAWHAALAWLAVVLLVFIFVPVRSRLESLEKQTYVKTVVINNEELKKLGLIP